MPRNKVVIILALLIAMLPVLGFPHRWESFFEILAGLSIVGLSVWSVIDKKLTQKAKAQKRHAHRRPAAEPAEKTEEGNPIEKEWSEIIERDKVTE